MHAFLSVHFSLYLVVFFFRIPGEFPPPQLIVLEVTLPQRPTPPTFSPISQLSRSIYQPVRFSILLYAPPVVLCSVVFCRDRIVYLTLIPMLYNVIFLEFLTALCNYFDTGIIHVSCSPNFRCCFCIVVGVFVAVWFLTIPSIYKWI